MRSADGEQKKPPARITVAVESKILASREEAAQMLSISQRALDYLSRFPSFESMRGPTIQNGSWPEIGPPTQRIASSLRSLTSSCPIRAWLASSGSR